MKMDINTTRTTFEPTGLGLSIFNERYAHDGETWQDACKRVARAVAAAEDNGNVAKFEERFYQQLVNGLFMPGGRIWYGSGRRVQQLLNCVSGDTLVHTENGLVPARDLEGKEVPVLSAGGVYRLAKWASYGEQELFKVVFENGDEIKATAGHEWVVTRPHGGDERVTTEHLVGRRVPLQGRSVHSLDPYSYRAGIQHGLVYGDGSIHQDGKSYILQFGNSKHLVEDYFDKFTMQTHARYPDGVMYSGSLSPVLKKEIPSVQECGHSYVFGFLAGYIGADGNVDDRGTVTLHSSSYKDLVEVRRLASEIGIPTVSLKKVRDSNPFDPEGEDRPLYCLRFAKNGLDSRLIIKKLHQEKFENSPKVNKRTTVKVVSVIPTGCVEKVYCCHEPETNTWVAGAGYLTGNCFVLPTGDSREEWGQSVKDMLIVSGVGGGVGANFSPVRGRGYPVKGTGGVSTGAVSLMHMWDRVGDILVSGGGRRLALMLCLDIDHPDIEEFLHEKLDLNQLENANVSVVLPSHISTDDFVKLVEDDGDIELRFNNLPDKVCANCLTATCDCENKTGRKIKARKLWSTLVNNAWRSGEPGILNGYEANQKNNIWYYKPLISTNPCFTSDQMLLTSEGYKSFGELYASGRPVQVLADQRVSYTPSEDGIEHPENWQVNFTKDAGYGTVTRQATQVELTQKNAEVVRVITQLGQEVVCTPDHHFATDKGMVEAQDLTPDHKILVALPGTDESVVGREPETEEEKAAFLMGLIAGDGTFDTAYKNPAAFVDIWQDDDLAHRVSGYVEDLAPSYEMSRFRSDVQILTKNHVEKSGKVRIGSAPLAEYLQREYGFCRETKHKVPAFVLTSTRASKFYLAGLFYADGAVNWNPNNGNVSVRLAQSNKKMLQDVQLVLHVNGIMSRLYLRREAGERMMPDGRGGSKMYPHKAQYELVISGPSRFRFAETLGFGGHVAKESKLAQANSAHPNTVMRPYTKIKSVEPAGHADVYCLQEPVARTIIVNGMSVRRCGEIWLEEYGCCDLGALVLPRFVVNGKMDWDTLEETIRLGVRFLDNVLDVNSYPIPEIEKNCKEVRRIGLGVMGLHSMLLDLGMRYNSPEAYEFIDKLFAFIKNTSYDTSVSLAIEKGPFPAFDPKMADSGFMKTVKRAIRSKVREYGVRNCALLTIAPTGTTSMVQGVTGGIEPLFSPVYIRRRKTIDSMAKETKKRTLVVSQEYLEHPDNVQGAYDIHPRDHLEMQKIVQKHIDNAVSKTINLPKDFPVDELGDLWLEYLPHMKGSTFYRQASRGEEPMEHVPAENMTSVVNNWKEEIEYEIPDVMDCAGGVCEIKPPATIESTTTV